MSGIQLHGGLSHDSHVTRCDGRTTRAVSGLGVCGVRS